MAEAKGTLHIFSEIAFANSFVLPQNNMPADTIIKHDTVQNKKDTLPPPPTFEQLRYWRLLRENKLLIDGSRYIQQKDKVKLVSSVKPGKESLGLPIREKNIFNTDWITIIIILVLILFASVRIAYSKYIGYLFQSLISYSTSFRMFGEKNYSISHAAFRLDIIFYITFSLFLYQIAKFFQLELINENLPIYVVNLGVVIGYFILKKIAYYFVGLVFENAVETSEYLFNMDNFNRILGIVLFPVAVLINYYPFENPVFMVVTGILIVSVFYAFLLQRGILILLRKQFSIFYLFLYLCTLEFLPLFLIYNVVVL
ncbi:MAG: DUF4271 domain-containing protein [Draconibacterium sp.]|nr:DUF4271 domain-containing protein [Draconibacterium sp.]